MTLSVADAEQLSDSWQLALRAERKSPQTLKAYGDGVRFYLAWCAENVVEPFTRPALNLWVAELLEGGSPPPPPAPASSQSAASPPGWPRRARSRPTRFSGSRHPSSTSG